MEGFAGYNCWLSYYLLISVYQLEKIIARKEIHYKFQYLEIKMRWLGDHENDGSLFLGFHKSQARITHLRGH